MLYSLFEYLHFFVNKLLDEKYWEYQVQKDLQNLFHWSVISLDQQATGLDTAVQSCEYYDL